MCSASVEIFRQRQIDESFRRSPRFSTPGRPRRSLIDRGIFTAQIGHELFPFNIEMVAPNGTTKGRLWPRILPRWLCGRAETAEVEDDPTEGTDSRSFLAG